VAPAITVLIEMLSVVENERHKNKNGGRALTQITVDERVNDECQVRWRKDDEF
jgi:hypothetical protein